MSERKGPRRAIAELRWEAGAEPVERVGGRSLHQYWPVLSPYFRDVLLPPSRRPGEDAVTWNWREPEGARAVSAAELRALRKRLAGELELLAANLERAEGMSGSETPQSGGGIRGLAATMAGVVERLVAGSDPELAGYVARTEAGLRLHSWGADAPARVQYPDTAEAKPGVGTRTAVRKERAGGQTRWRRWAVRLMVVGVVALIVVGGVLWNSTDPQRPGDEENAEAKANREKMPAGPRVEPTTNAGKTAGVVREAKAERRSREDAGRKESSDGDQGEREGVTTARAIDRAPGVSEALSSRTSPRAQRPVLPEERRGVPLAPNGRPDRENPASGGRAGGALRDGDSAKMGEKPGEVGALGDERVAGTNGGEMRRDAPAGQRSGAAEPVEPSAGKEEKRARKLRQEDEAREMRGEREASERAAASGGVVGIEWGTKRAAVSEIGWQREVRMRRRRWETRMLVDVIVPTRPVRLGEVARMENLRERMLDEARARMPTTLRELQWRGGVGFEVNGNSAGWRWRGDGAETRGEWREGRAEMECEEGGRAREGRWTLENENAEVIAEVRAGGEEWVILAREGVRMYQWFAVVVVREERGARWSWRRASAGDLPGGVVVGRSGEADEARVEVALAVAEPLAFFDRSTGWAAVAEMSGTR